MRYISFAIHTSMEDLLNELMTNCRDDLLELIKEMDRRAHSYDFTEHLRDYFVEEMMKEDALCQKKPQKANSKQEKKSIQRKTSETK